MFYSIEIDRQKNCLYQPLKPDQVKITALSDQSRPWPLMNKQLLCIVVFSYYRDFSENSLVVHKLIKGTFKKHYMKKDGGIGLRVRISL